MRRAVKLNLVATDTPSLLIVSLLQEVCQNDFAYLGEELALIRGKYTECHAPGANLTPNAYLVLWRKAS